MFTKHFKKAFSVIAKTLAITSPAVSFVGCTDYGAPAPEEQAQECCKNVTAYEKCYNYYMENTTCKTDWSEENQEK